MWPIFVCVVGVGRMQEETQRAQRPHVGRAQSKPAA